MSEQWTAEIARMIHRHVKRDSKRFQVVWTSGEMTEVLTFSECVDITTQKGGDIIFSSN